jgi:hypothetical protein
MPAQPCANHPKELTLVRCGRCDRPICVRCMVDTPVGKKCRDCARNRTHVTESSPRQVLPAFFVATLAALPMGLLLQALAFPVIPAVIFGYLVAQVALWAGQRRRSLAMQVAAGLAALIGALAGSLPQLFLWGVLLFGRPPETPVPGLQVHAITGLVIPLLNTIIGTAVAVSRVKYL